MSNFEISPDRQAYNMMSVAYRDYIAARYLLNNDFLLQGLGLSSLAVEKYLKSLLFKHGESLNIHLNQWVIIKSAFEKHGISLFEELDEKYLELLGRAFSLRYYDRLSSYSQYAFIKWQVLAELDFTISIIESKTTFRNQENVEIKTQYQLDVESRNPHLFLENYVLQHQSKKGFMEREGLSVMVFFDTDGTEVVAQGPLRCNEYSGQIVTANKIELR
jgi:hypothetical protein